MEWPRWSPLIENEGNSFLRPHLRHQQAPQMLPRGGPWQALITPIYAALRTQSEPQPALFDEVAQEYRRAIRILGRHLARLHTKNTELGLASTSGLVPASTARSGSEELEILRLERDKAGKRADELEDQLKEVHARAEQAENAGRLVEYERDNIRQQRDEAREMLRRHTHDRIANGKSCRTGTRPGNQG